MDTCLASAGGTAQPLYFKSRESALFGWLHRPPSLSEGKLGVVICNPFGYESICAHRSVREFAEAISARGIPALRFDYVSTGDSGDADENIDHIRLWTQDVRAAIDELRLQTGVERICLLGIRLGALLATLAVAECVDVESLVLLGPVVSGRRYVNELRTTQLAGLALAANSAAERAESTQGAGPRVLEAGGFCFPAATLQSLMQVDLHTAPTPAVRSMLIIDDDKLPAAKRWTESLSQSGITLEYKRLPGLIAMAMTAPQFAAVPQTMLDATLNWLATVDRKDVEAPIGGRSVVDERPARRTSLAVATLPPLEEQESAESPAQTWITEQPVFISTDVALFGILTAPRSDEKRRRVVLLLNAGADSHIGASRMYVSFARRWARRGFVVLRLDFAGIGDSATRAGKANDDVFPDEAIDDIRSAIDFIRSRYAAVDITVAGLCSGAYHALRAAVAGLDVHRVLMVNPQNYFWEKGMTLEQLQLAEVVHNPGLYRRQVLSLGAWRRLFTGKTNIVRIVLIYLQRTWLAAEAVARDCARRLSIRLPHDLGWDLERIVAGGIRVTLIFARGEPGIDLLKLQAGSALSRLGDRCRIRIIDSGDHIFSRRGPRLKMEQVLCEELFAPVDDTGAGVDRRAPRVLQQVQ